MKKHILSIFSLITLLCMLSTFILPNFSMLLNVSAEENIENDSTYPRIKLTKTSSVDSSVIPGATYGLYSDKECTSKNLKETKITDLNGELAFDTPVKPTDNYYVKEISPAIGYKPDNTVYPVETVRDIPLKNAATSGSKVYNNDSTRGPENIVDGKPSTFFDGKSWENDSDTVSAPGIPDRTAWVMVELPDLKEYYIDSVTIWPRIDIYNNSARIKELMVQIAINPGDLTKKDDGDWHTILDLSKYFDPKQGGNPYPKESEDWKRAYTFTSNDLTFNNNNVAKYIRIISHKINEHCNLGELQIKAALKDTVYTDDSDTPTTLVDNWVNLSATGTPTEETPVPLEICKTSSDTGEPISGAEYTVYSDEDCTNALAVLTTGDDGKTTPVDEFEGLTEGSTVYVKETKSPKEYELDTTVYPVKYVSTKSEPAKITTSNYSKTFDLYAPGFDVDKVFDGDITTYLDGVNKEYLTTSSSFTANLGLEDDSNDYFVTKIRYYPRTGKPERLNGCSFTLVDDNGENQLVHTIGTISTVQWYEFNVDDIKSNQLIYTIPKGDNSRSHYPNIAEIEIYGYKKTWDYGEAEFTDNKLLLSVTDDPKGTHIPLEICKTSSDTGEPISGAEYTVYSDEDCTNALAVLTTGDDGKTTPVDEFEGLTEGSTVYVKETKSPKEYELDTTVYPVKYVSTKSETDIIPLKNTTGNPSITGKIYNDNIEKLGPQNVFDGSTNTYVDGSTANAELTAILEDDYTITSIRYFPRKGKEATIGDKAFRMNGLKFYLNDKNNLVYSHPYKPNNDYTASDVNWHTFTVDHINANKLIVIGGMPKSDSNPSEYGINIAEIEIYGYKTTWDYGEAEFTDDKLQLSVTDVPKKTLSLTLIKRNANNHEELLEGASYSLYSDSACNNLIETKTTGNDGKLSFEPIIEKEDYYLKETQAPDNFKLDDTIYHLLYDDIFYVNDDDYEITNNKITLYMDDVKEKLKLQVTKIYTQDGINNTYLKDAEFTLYTDEDCTTILDTVNTNTNGKGVFTSDLITGSYYLKETKAPTGYQIDNTIRKIEVKDGKAFYGDNELQNIGNDTVNITIGNTLNIKIPTTGIYLTANHLRIIGIIICICGMTMFFIIVIKKNKNMNER